MEPVTDRRSLIKKRILRILFILFNAVIIGSVVFLEFRNGEGADHIDQIKLNPWFLAGGVCCFIAAAAIETVKYYVMMRELDGRSDVKGAFACAILGKYYDNVTPFGAGGQPFQIYYLHSRGYSDGVSGALPIAGFIGNQLAFVIIAIAILIVTGIQAGTATVIQVASYVGLAFYLFVPVCLIFFSIFPGQMVKLINKVIYFLGKIRLVKDPDKTASNLVKSLESYRNSIKMIARQRGLFIVTVICSFLYQAAILAMPFFVLRAFGVPAHFIASINQVVLVMLSCTIVPTPGNAGAAEGSFYMVFADVAQGAMFWAVLLWRILCYYSWIFLGVIYYVRRSVKSHKAK